MFVIIFLQQMKKIKGFETETLYLWEHTDSNRGPSACKADALNQLSYAPESAEEPV